MWKKARLELPKIAQNYNVFGVVNVGTNQQAKKQFFAYFNTRNHKWQDPFFENKDLTEIDIEFWFDFELVKIPL